MPIPELVDIGNTAGDRFILKRIDLTLESVRIRGRAGQYVSGVCIDVPSHPQYHELISHFE